jgi:hypothetical protein
MAQVSLFGRVYLASLLTLASWNVAASGWGGASLNPSSSRYIEPGSSESAKARETVSAVEAKGSCESLQKLSSSAQVAAYCNPSVANPPAYTDVKACLLEMREHGNEATTKASSGKESLLAGGRETQTATASMSSGGVKSETLTHWSDSKTSFDAASTSFKSCDEALKLAPSKHEILKKGTEACMNASSTNPQRSNTYLHYRDMAEQDMNGEDAKNKGFELQVAEIAPPTCEQAIGDAQRQSAHATQN